MLAKSLIFITKFLNKEIKMSFGINENRVIASSLINPDGSITSNIENKIIVSVINLEHETTMKSMKNYITDASGNYGKIAPPVHLNLFLLISANYDSGNYLEAHKMLSAVISTFQANPFFTKQDYPEMEAPVEKLTFEIFNLPINELSHIWSGIGAKYVPSIIYKVRMMAMQQQLIQKEIPGITGIQPGVRANKK